MAYGSAISEVLTKEYPAKLIRMGMKDRFGKSGPAKELSKVFGLTAQNIIETIEHNWLFSEIMLI